MAAEAARGARKVWGYSQDPQALDTWMVLYKHLPKRGFAEGWEQWTLQDTQIR